MYYQAKPVLIEAMKIADLLFMPIMPDWCRAGFDSGIIVKLNGGIEVKALHDAQFGTADDWLIRDPDGTLRICDAATFDKTYILV